MATFPRIVSLASAYPPYSFSQAEMLDQLRAHVLGSDWAARPETAERGRQIARLFTASRVARRHSAVDLPAFYRRARTTSERMAEYQRAALPLGHTALATCLAASACPPARTISDLYVVSCTGYSAPGLDILLARDLGLPRDVRRVVIGHMGCHGALVGLRQALATLRADQQAVVALLAVELTTLHFMPALDPEVLTSFALFGDAAAAALLTTDPTASGPELVDTYCAADFDAAGQMSWTITDTGFVMSLSPRIPITLRRNILPAVERLLTPHGLTAHDVTHWLVHPGGPSILTAIQGKLELTDAQIAPSWQTLREHGNCSSATVLLMLDALVRSGQAHPGEWAVMMAFGPGLTLETCLLRF
ncbi:MAG: type III polyketide synthase [Ktedonobacterales bacterium]|nr:type III polyketide synthase [Ktedonobacterales bacterium]